MSSRPSPHDRGFVLLEIAIALLVLAGSVASLAPVIATCGVMLQDARRETLALAVAAARLEQLAALSYEQRGDTLAEVVDRTADLTSVPPGSGGQGLEAGDGQSAWREVPGFTDWGLADGRPRNEAAGDTVFVRRWAVATIASASDDNARLLHVFARDRPSEDREPPRASAARRPGDVWLFTVRSRVLR
jgi:hypothetical protein